MPIINAQDLEVVKLTALYVAKRGKSFMTTLSQREARNFQFDFLRPQHSLYQFFTRLVDQYTILLRPEGIDDATTQQKRIAELEHNVKNKYHILERANQRAEWVKYQEQQKHQKEEQVEQERIDYAQIDWHDFVVVETVLFTESDDQADLPPPTSLTDLQSASLEQKAAMSLNPLRIEEAMPTDLDNPTYYNAYPAQPEPSFPSHHLLSPLTQPKQRPHIRHPRWTMAGNIHHNQRHSKPARSRPCRHRVNLPCAFARTTCLEPRPAANKLRVPLRFARTATNRFPSPSWSITCASSCSIRDGKNSAPRPNPAVPRPTCPLWTSSTTSSGSQASVAMCLTPRLRPILRRKRAASAWLWVLLQMAHFLLECLRNRVRLLALQVCPDPRIQTLRTRFGISTNLPSNDLEA